MNLNGFIEKVNAVDWAKFTAAGEQVAQSLIALAAAEYEEPQTVHGRREYPRVSGNVINAIGNNHSGSYSPVAAVALPFIIEVALHGGNEFSREYAITILYDLYWFATDDKALKKSVNQAIYARLDDFAKLAEKDSHNRQLLEDFIESMRDSLGGICQT